VVRQFHLRLPICPAAQVALPPLCFFPMVWFYHFGGGGCVKYPVCPNTISSTGMTNPMTMTTKRKGNSMKTRRRVSIYARVSTTEQNVDVRRAVFWPKSLIR